MLSSCTASKLTRGIALGLVAIVWWGLTACGGTSQSKGSGRYRLTLIVGVRGDEFYTTMACGAQEEARKLGVDLTVQGPAQFDPSLQTPIVNAVAAAKPDAVMIAPTDATAMYAPVKHLADDGIKVVFVDTTLNQAGFGVSQIGSDNEAAGAAAAKALAALIGGSGKVFVINVKPGISTTDLRAKGFADESKVLGLQYLGQQYSQNEPAVAASVMKATLAANPDIKGVFGTNLFSAEGAATGLQAAGRAGTVKIVGFDAGPVQVKQLREGLVQALIAQQPYIEGQNAVQQAVAALEGKPVQKMIRTGVVTITQANLATEQTALYKSSC
jgi:ribose transport system substrate-binding protein